MKLEVALLILLVISGPKQDDSVVVRVEDIHLIDLRGVQREKPVPQEISIPGGLIVLKWNIDGLPCLPSLDFELSLPGHPGHEPKSGA